MPDQQRASGKLPARRLALLAAVGAAVGTLAEMAHQHASVWVLPAAAQVPWWIAVVYFFGLAAAGYIFFGVERRLGFVLERSAGALAIEAALLLSWFLAPVILHPHEVLFTLLALGYLSLRLLVWRAPGDIAIVLIAVVLDLAIELSLIAAGLFHYSNARWFAVPLWLAPLWGRWRRRRWGR